MTQPFPPMPLLETSRLLLRPLRLEDAPDLFAYASDPEVTPYVTWDTHRSIEDTLDFLRASLGKYTQRQPGDWGLVFKVTQQVIGTCGYVSWTPRHRRAEIGYVLSCRFWNQGLMSEALAAVIAFGFGPLDLNRLIGRCWSENQASARVLEKAGFIWEGTLREHWFYKGRFRSLKAYALLREDYETRSR